MKVLISSHQNGFTNQENQKATKAFTTWLKHNQYTYEPCVGVYKGKKETAFLIKTTKHGLPLIEAKAWANNQECILTMNDNGENACLVYPDAIPMSLGKFRKVFKFQAMVRESYTILHGRYYVAG